MRRLLAKSLVVLFGLSMSAFNVVRDPGGGGPIVWAVPQVSFQIHQDGSDDIAGDADILAIRAALTTWNQVACSRFRFTDGGLSSSRTIAADGTNRIAFLESNWPGGADGAAAYTVRERNFAQWTEVDIRINGVDFNWSTTGEAQRPDLQSVVVHELGHALGLMHSADPEATMFYAVRRGTTHARTLHPDDTRGVCFLYPAAATPCGTDLDCPILWAGYGGSNQRTRCEGGTCVEGAANSYGTECFGGADCASGFCAADPSGPPSADPGFCTQSCTAGSCPNGDVCAQDRCVIGRDDCVADADCGGMNRVCARDLDGRFRCRRLCLQNSVCFQLPGAVCHGGTGENPPGFCRVPGAKQPGEPCAHGLECRSLACTQGGATPTCAEGTPGFDGDAGTLPRVDAGPGGKDAGGLPIGSDASNARRDASSLEDASTPELRNDGPLIGGCGCSALGSRPRAPAASAWLVLVFWVVLTRAASFFKEAFARS